MSRRAARARQPIIWKVRVGRQRTTPGQSLSSPVRLSVRLSRGVCIRWAPGSVSQSVSGVLSSLFSPVDMTSSLWWCLGLLMLAVLSSPSHARSPAGDVIGEGGDPTEQPVNLHHSIKDLQHAASKTVRDIGTYVERRVTTAAMRGLNKLSAPVAKILAPVVYLRDRINSMFGMGEANSTNSSRWCPTCLEHECEPGTDGCADHDVTTSNDQQGNILFGQRQQDDNMVELVLLNIINEDKSFKSNEVDAENEIGKNAHFQTPIEDTINKESNSIISKRAKR